LQSHQHTHVCYDIIEAWTLILSWADQQPIDAFRRIYERFLTIFPTSGRHWRVYIEQGSLGPYHYLDIIIAYGLIAWM
jgi:hypothetical protein